MYKMRRYNAIDLFAGCGGLSLGLANAGFNVLLANELNRDAAKTYAHNLIKKQGHNTNLVVGDVRGLSAKEILLRIGNQKIHLVAGGPPCQGFSMAGMRNIDDPRNVLFKQMLRIVEEIKPPIFLLENVKGILTMDNGRVINAIKHSFESIGYHVEIKVLDASNFGVPQKRERVLILGTLGDHAGIHPEPTQNLPVTVGEAISDLAFLPVGKNAGQYRTTPESEYQKKMRRNCQQLTNHEAPNHSKRVITRFAALKEGQTAKDLPRELKTKKIVLYKMDRNMPSRTITTLPDDYVHYLQDRILTVREMARLQSFPDDFEFLGPKSTGGSRRKHDVPQYSQVGNAIPPILAEAVGKRLLEVLDDYYFEKPPISRRVYKSLPIAIN